MNKLNITEYNLLDYSLKLQEAIEKGYRIGDSVNDSPMKIGNAYTATVSAVVSLFEKEVVVESVSEEQQLELPQEVILIESTTTLDETLQAADEQCDKVEAVVKEIVSKAPSKRGRK